MNSYRTQIKSEYGIINSKHLGREKYDAVDYFILNNKMSLSETSTPFPYQNKSNSEVQVSLFYGDEILNPYDYHKKTPYFSTLLESGKTYHLPLQKNKETYLYRFDINGNRIDKQTIQPSQITEKQ